MESLSLGPSGNGDLFEPVIGLEVHAQLKTRTKIFCGCRTDFGASPNSQTCPVCLGLPGALPVLNDRAVVLALRVALATGCTVGRRSVFARKNYFYPDVPKNYQISQFKLPLAEGGSLEVAVAGRPRRFGITRIHLEEDAGKLLHRQARPSATGRSGTCVDLNRAGVPLVEIVSAPDMRSGEEAYAYLDGLRRLLIHLDVCSGNLEEGAVRCDANVSLRPVGSSGLGTKVELKNLNSLRGVRRALDFEIVRQRNRLQRGGQICQETRSWEADRGETEFLRSKEHAHDYRYFPDPDLPPLAVSQSELATLSEALPELPGARMERLQQQYGLPAYDADLLCESPRLADYFEAVAAETGDAKLASNWIMGEVLGHLNERGGDISEFAVPPGELASLLALIADGSLSGTAAKEVLTEMIESQGLAADIVAAHDLAQISDPAAIGAEVDRVLAEHPEQVAAYRGGKVAVLGYLVGQVMAATGGKANPRIVGDLLRAALDPHS